MCGKKDSSLVQWRGYWWFWELAPPSFRKRWNYPSTPKKLPAFNCEPLCDIMGTLHLHHVDFFSLDVEGAEESFLESICWEKFSACVACVEADGNNKAEDAAVVRMFLTHGYKHAGLKNRSNWFLNEKHPRCSYLVN